MEEIIKLDVTQSSFLETYVRLRTRNSLPPTEILVLIGIIKLGGINPANKKELRKELGMDIHTFNNILGALKKKNFIEHLKWSTYVSNIKNPIGIKSLKFEFNY